MLIQVQKPEAAGLTMAAVRRMILTWTSELKSWRSWRSRRVLSYMRSTRALLKWILDLTTCLASRIYLMP